jgi:hypothetical protein
MIQYTDDFTGVTYPDKSGNLVTVPFTDGAEFNRLVAIRDQQLKAIEENKLVLNNYNQIVKNDQISEDASRPYPALPPKPQKKIVGDDGIVTMVDFGSELLAIVPKGSTVPSSGSIKTTVNVPADPATQVQAMLTVLLQQNAVILAALKKAGLM